MAPVAAVRFRQSMRTVAVLRTTFLAVVAAACAPRPPAGAPPAPPAPPPAARAPAASFEATAYSQEGTTASGAAARVGIVAADPKVLPLGTRIRVSGTGGYDGEYVVKDTGRTVKGREIDLYLANDREAQRFGRKTVRVDILEHGSGDPDDAKKTPVAPR
jgi:3D (Asp-Asp-Asp) domain-containing protein